MKKQVTIHDIARKAEVSSATVSRVLSNSGYPVSAATKEKIKRIAKEMKYVPNLLGKQLKTNMNNTLGIIIPSITNPFYSAVILGIEEIARKNNYNVLLCNTLDNAKLEDEYLRTIFEKQVRGLIISSISSNRRLLKQYMELGLNVIALDQPIADKDVCRVEFDYRKGGYMATRYLLDKGHSEIAFITSLMDRPSRRSVYDGYMQAMQEAGFAPDMLQVEKETMFEGIYEFDNGKKMAALLLQRDRRPTAVFASNDMIAIGAINELAAGGMSVPEDMSVIGFDGIELGKMITPALTTIKQPDYEMGRLACTMLIDLLRGDTETLPDVVLQPKLVERSSVNDRRL